MTPSNPFELHTFGAIELRDSNGNQLLSVLSQPKRLALLLYLATTRRGQLRRRDSIVALFWPELDDEHARGALRQALSFLRRSLGEGVIVTRADEIGVDPLQLRLDVHAFDDARAESRLDDALRLYAGDFAEGFFVADASPELDRWFDEERARLRSAAREAAWQLGREAHARGEADAAAAWARRAAALAPQDEAELRRLIMLLDELGDRAGAVQAYHQFADRLAAEYDVAPSPGTQALIEEIRRRTGQPAGSAPAAGAMAEPPFPATSGANTGSGATVPRHARRRPTLVELLASLGVLALAGYLLAFFAVPRHPRHDLIRVAVLPMVDLGADTSQALVSAALTDQLITELAQLPGLDVVNPRTMMTYRSSSKNVDQISRELRADVLLTTSLQHTGGAIHVNAHLVRPGENSAFWARSYDGTPEDLLPLQRRIAVAALAGLGRETIPQMPGSGRAIDARALDLYVRGRHWWNRRGGPALLQSIDYFQRALDIEPSFALAYSGLGDAYVQLGYASLLRPDDAFPKARAAALSALELDSTLAEPHATLAFVAMYFDWNWTAAEQEFRRALARNPNYATAHEWYGLFLAAMGRFDEALAQERRAQDLDPLSVPVAATAGWVLHYSGRQNDATRELKIVLREDPTFALGHLYLGRVYQAQGQFDSALAQYEAMGPLRTWVPTIAGVGNVYGLQGRRTDALETISQMDSLARTQYVTAYAYALVHAALGQPDSAFAWLDRAVKERTHWLVWLNRDFRWAPVRADPRFAQIGRRVGLPP